MWRYSWVVLGFQKPIYLLITIAVPWELQRDAFAVYRYLFIFFRDYDTMGTINNFVSLIQVTSYSTSGIFDGPNDPNCVKAWHTQKAKSTWNFVHSKIAWQIRIFRMMGPTLFRTHWIWQPILEGRAKSTWNFVHSRTKRRIQRRRSFARTKFGNATTLDKSEYVRTGPHNNIHNNDNNINLEDSSASTQVKQPFKSHLAFGWQIPIVTS